jgi:signal transduction histidine kinase
MTTGSDDSPAAPTNWLRRRRAFGDGFIAMLDALDAGREVAATWQANAYRRRIASKAGCLSTAERRQMRDFIVRNRGWRGSLASALIVAIDCVIGYFVAPTSSASEIVEAMILVNLGVCCLGLGIVGAWFTPGRVGRFGPRAFVVLPILIVAGALVGGLSTTIASGRPLPLVVQRSFAAGLILGFVITVVMGLIVAVRNRELAAVNAQLLVEADRQRLVGEVAASRLRLLRAQIEPHFLFNTLGAVQQLAEGHAPEAAALTADLIRFLRHSVSGLDRTTTTLGDEAEVIESYLQIMRSRLGARLAYGIDVPDALRTCDLQPTILLTLVENAIKHGIEPAPRGGAIRVSASMSDAVLTIEVADTGVGLGDAIGDGHGLRNVKEQLALAYEGRATLDMLENEPSGLVVRIGIPRERS